MVPARPRDGVGVDRVEFVADLAPAFVLEPYLPEKICAETRQFAAVFDIGLDRETHLARPVFVMANDCQARIGVEQRWPIMQVRLRDEVEFIARLLRPDDEVPIELRPARGPVILAETIRIGPFHLRITRSVAEFRKGIGADARRARRKPDDPARPWPLQRKHWRGEIALRSGHAEIVVGSSEIVVRRPRARGQDDQNLRLARLICRSDDKEMMLDELAEVCARASRDDPVKSRAEVFR